MLTNRACTEIREMGQYRLGTAKVSYDMLLLLKFDLEIEEIHKSSARRLQFYDITPDVLHTKCPIVNRDGTITSWMNLDAATHKAYPTLTEEDVEHLERQVGACASDHDPHNLCLQQTCASDNSKDPRPL